MECNTGTIHQFDGENEAERQRKLDELTAAFSSQHDKKLLPLTEDQAGELMPLPKPMRKNKMRNKPCVCGSGIKFKRCCWNDYA